MPTVGHLGARGHVRTQQSSAKTYFVPMGDMAKSIQPVAMAVLLGSSREHAIYQFVVLMYLVNPLNCLGRRALPIDAIRGSYAS